MTDFADLGLIDPLLRAVAAQGYETPTPIQIKAIPPLLKGRDVLGCAQTGTGKTAAFSLPVLQFLAEEPSHAGRRPIRALVLSPTRELAAQIGENFEAYAKFTHVRHTVIFGGVKPNPQIRALQRGIDVLVATPGRMLDLMGQGYIKLNEVEFFILDEADRMLDMGFIHDIRRVLRVLPTDRQNLLFSATMPKSIADLASNFLHDPIRVEVTPQSTPVERIKQTVMFVQRADKRRLLAQLVHDHDIERAIVFTRTKHGANRLVKQLDRYGLNAAAIHGNKSQNARRRAMDGFKKGEIALLVATDIAARGIDVEGVTHVFNFDLPNEPETYVHRIGRTARAGKEGIAIAFCDETEGPYLRDIEKLTGIDIPVDTDHEFHFPEAIPSPLRRRKQHAPPRRRRNHSQGRRPQGQGRGGDNRGGGGGRNQGGGGGRGQGGQRQGGGGQSQRQGGGGQSTRSAPRSTENTQRRSPDDRDESSRNEGDAPRRRRRRSGGDNEGGGGHNSGGGNRDPRWS